MAIVMAAGIMGTIIRTAASSAGMMEAGSHNYESFQSILFHITGEVLAIYAKHLSY